MTLYPANLTAASLYEIVRDVPRDAWPESLWWHQMGRWTNEDSEWWIADDLAALAFIGSMTAWLLSEFDDIEIQTTSVGVEVTNETGHYEAPTLIEAMSAACKGVGT